MYVAFVVHNSDLGYCVIVKMPAYTIAANAGVEGAVVVGKLLKQDNLDLGYDAAKGKELISTVLCSGCL